MGGPRSARPVISAGSVGGVTVSQLPGALVCTERGLAAPCRGMAFLRFARRSSTGGHITDIFHRFHFFYELPDRATARLGSSPNTFLYVIRYTALRRPEVDL